MINAILPVWKPSDWTSFDVVKKIRGQIKPTKVGHAGTLDPFAEGILLLCLGKSTKKVESLMSLEKEYIATIKLGEETDTQDYTGNIIKTSDIPKLSESKIISILSKFIGNIQQIPPMYSALKHNGQRLYSLARKGIEVERQPRNISIHDIELLSYSPDLINIRVRCGRGTYIRTLGVDIASALKTCGHLISLKRTKIGQYCEDNAIKIDGFKEWLSTAV